MLCDFSKEECLPFYSAIHAKYPRQSQDYFEQIYAWTNGHPNLTQYLCRALVNWLGGDLPVVDELVEALFLSLEAPINESIRRIQDRIRSDREVQDMLKVYKRIRIGEIPISDPEISQAIIDKLKVYGLVVEQSGQFKVRNKLYARIFDGLRLLPHRERYRLAIVAVIKGDQGPIGTGFLVNFNEKIYVVTCAHVINGQPREEKLILLHSSHHEFLDAKICWLPSKGSRFFALGDISILEVLSPLPPESEPFTIKDLQDHRPGNRCFCFGYVQRAHPVGDWIEDLSCQHQVAGNFVRLSQSQSKIEKGASGAPLSTDQGRILGMIHAYVDYQEHDDEYAYFIPSRVIRHVFYNLLKSTGG